MRFQKVMFLEFKAVYYLASNKPLGDLNAEASFYVNQIGIENLRFEGAEEDEAINRNLWKKWYNKDYA